MRKLLITLAVLSVSAVAAAGCGNDNEAASGATELVPAGAVLYGEADIKPKGEQKQAIDSILSKFPGGGQAGEKLKDLIDKGLRESDAPISFKKDVEPWLGDEAAFFAGGMSRTGELEATAGLIAADDEDKARDALEKSAEGKIVKHDYKDVEYLTDDSGEAGAVFDGFLVLGTEAGVKAAIETSKGGKPLSDDSDYRKATENAADDRLGLFYLNSPQFLQAARQTGAPLPESFDKLFDEPIVATADADDDGVLVEANVPARLAQSFAFFGEGSDLLADMPGDSWLALGQKDLGKLIDFYADVFAGVAGGRDAIERQLKAATGLDLQQDVISWMGDFGLFVRGTSLDSLDGAVEIETSDEAASARFLAALARIAKAQADNPGDRVGPLSAPGGGKGYTFTSPDIPKPIHAFVKSGKVVVAYGDAAAKDAIAAGGKLGDSPDFTAAGDSLGDYNVSFYMLVKPILDLVESTSAGSEAGWQEAKPYLEPLSALVAGTSGSGDDLKSAFKLIVK
jgi:Protein of unknown function (DUF3352)